MQCLETFRNTLIKSWLKPWMLSCVAFQWMMFSFHSTLYYHHTVCHIADLIHSKSSFIILCVYQTDSGIARPLLCCPCYYAIAFIRWLLYITLLIQSMNSTEYLATYLLIANKLWIWWSLTKAIMLTSSRAKWQIMIKKKQHILYIQLHKGQAAEPEGYGQSQPSVS